MTDQLLLLQEENKMQLKQQLFEEAEDLSTFLVSVAKVSGFASSFSSSLSLHLFCPLQVTLNHLLSVYILKFNESENYLMPVFLASISLSSPCQCTNFSFFTPMFATFHACLSLLLFFLRFLLIFVTVLDLFI